MYNYFVESLDFGVGYLEWTIPITGIGKILFASQKLANTLITTNYYCVSVTSVCVRVCWEWRLAPGETRLRVCSYDFLTLHFHSLCVLFNDRGSLSANCSKNT